MTEPCTFRVGDVVQVGSRVWLFGGRLGTVGDIRRACAGVYEYRVDVVHYCDELPLWFSEGELVLALPMMFYPDERADDY